MELLPLPLPRRRRHRRRVLGDQQRDRRADPGARARLGRPRDQRLLVARHGGRRAALDRPPEPEHLPDRPRLAPRVRPRRDPRHRRPPDAPRGAGEPALADDQGPQGGGGADRRRDRAAGLATTTGETLDEPDEHDRDRAARSTGVRRDRARRCSRATRPHRPRADDDERAGVRLQRGLLHVRRRADDVHARRQGATSATTSSRSRSATSSGRCCSGRCSTRSAAASMLTATHAARGRRSSSCTASSSRRARSARLADAALVRGLLLRVGRGERGVPDGQRGVPAGDPRDGDRVLLRGRHRHRRHHRAGALREADLRRHRRDDGRLPDRGRLAARRRRPRVLPRGRRGAEVARGRRRAAVRDRRRRRRRRRHAADEPTHRERREIGGYPVSAGAHWSPRYSFHGADDPLEGQVAAIERAAADADHPLPERELLARTNARHWGPGVARRALRRAAAEGRIRREGRGYVASSVRR